MCLAQWVHVREGGGVGSAMDTAPGGVSMGAVTIVNILATMAYVLTPLSVPVKSIPVSLAGLIVCFKLCVLNAQERAIDCVICLLVKLINIPMFSNFATNPTGVFKPANNCLVKFVPVTIVTKVFVRGSKQGLMLNVVNVVLKATIYCVFKAM